MPQPRLPWMGVQLLERASDRLGKMEREVMMELGRLWLKRIKACLQQRITALIGTCNLLLSITTCTEVFSI